VVKIGIRTLWFLITWLTCLPRKTNLLSFLGAWLSELNRKKPLCHRVVKRGIRTLWFLIAWESVLNMKKLLCHRVVKRGIRTLWSLIAWVSGLNRRKLLCHRVDNRGIDTLWFLGAYVSELNRKQLLYLRVVNINRENYFAIGDSLESGNQDSTLWRWGPDPENTPSARRNIIPVETYSYGLSGPYDNSYFMILGSRYQIRDSVTTKAVKGNPTTVSFGESIHYDFQNYVQRVTPL